jgi:UDP-N-acetylglucosamine--N-acetylmuramyl-(pentapeptide) pyrophosphoryl-undecaprenol N-acetylglucosamine transferase
MVIDEFLDGDTLFQKVQELRSNSESLALLGEHMREEARPNALKEIVDIILEEH